MLRIIAQAFNGESSSQLVVQSNTLNTC